jgi:hypothetical protein
MVDADPLHAGEPGDRLDVAVVLRSATAAMAKRVGHQLIIAVGLARGAEGQPIDADRADIGAKSIEEGLHIRVLAQHQELVAIEEAGPLVFRSERPQAVIIGRDLR